MKLQVPDPSSLAERCVSASAASEQVLWIEMELMRGGRESREVMLNARDASLDFIYTEFALMFLDKAGASELRVALAAVLWSFYPVAGRVAKRGGQLVLLCNDEGVPLTHRKCGGEGSFREAFGKLSGSLRGALGKSSGRK